MQTAPTGRGAFGACAVIVGALAGGGRVNSDSFAGSATEALGAWEQVAAGSLSDNGGTRRHWWWCDTRHRHRRRGSLETQPAAAVMEATLLHLTPLLPAAAATTAPLLEVLKVPAEQVLEVLAGMGDGMETAGSGVVEVIQLAAVISTGSTGGN